MSRLVAEPRLRAVFLISIVALLLAAVALVPLKLVTVKMLPFDDKNEFQVIVNMPDGTPLEETARVTDTLAREADEAGVGHQRPELRREPPRPTTSTASCATTSCAGRPTRPTCRSTSCTRQDRSVQSHEIAKRVRDALTATGREVRRQDPGGGSSSRPASASDAGGRSLRAGPAAPARRRPAGARHLQQDRRRGRRGLVRRDAAARR